MSAGPNGTTALPLRLDGGPDGIEAFFVELAFWPASQAPPDCPASPEWPGAFACTTDDPLGLVRIAGTLESGNLTGIFEIAWLVWPDATDQPNITTIYARIETIGPDHHVTLMSTAASFGDLILPLPEIPASPLVDLSTAWHSHGDESLAACLILVRRLRVIESTMLYATDTELTLMVRMTDRGGAPDSNLTRVWLYLSACPPGGAWDQIAQAWGASPVVPDGLWLPAPLYDDGWYGVAYRGQLPAQALSVSLLHSTLDPSGEPGPNRSRVYGRIPQGLGTAFGASPDGAPYSSLTLGLATPTCPWDARAPAEIVLRWAVQVSLAVRAEPCYALPSS